MAGGNLLPITRSDVAEVEDERPEGSADRAVERSLEPRHRIEVDLPADSETRRSAQAGFDGLECAWSTTDHGAHRRTTRARGDVSAPTSGIAATG